MGTVGFWGVGILILGAAALAIRAYVTRAPKRFDAGEVSQSWLSEHKADRSER